jgi:multiple sugar transport system substrate-binding protein
MKFKSLVLSTAIVLVTLPAVAEDLVLSIGSRGYGPAVERNIESWSAANPEVSIKWNKVSDVPGDTRKLYVTSMSAKSPSPDIFAIDVIWAGEFAARGWLQPLDGLFVAKNHRAVQPSPSICCNS